MKFIQDILNRELKTIAYKEYHKIIGFKTFNGLVLTEILKITKDEEHKLMINDFLFNECNSHLSKRLNGIWHGYSIRVLKQVKFNSKIQEVIDILNSEPDKSYIVGGSVRDSIIGRAPHDWDLCTTIPYQDLKDLFENHDYQVQEEGKHFLVLMVTKNDITYEIANLRKDGTYSDGRRPESVDIGTIDDDAQRRDFTCNALYWNTKTELLEDPTGQGIMDIHDKVLRFVGKAEDRLKEDYLRAWRFLRFSKTLGFTPDIKSSRAIKSNFKEIYEGSNSTRVLQELLKFINV